MERYMEMAFCENVISIKILTIINKKEESRKWEYETQFILHENEIKW